MNEDELLQVWLNSSNKQQIKVNLPLLVAELRNKMEAIDRKIKARDQKEIVASILGMIAFLYLAYDIPFVWSKVACLLTVGWFGYVIYRLKATSQGKEPDAGLPLQAQLEARKLYLRNQARMLNKVLYWYVLPPFLINVIFFFGLGDPGVWDSPLATFLPEDLVSKFIVLGFIFVLYAYITWMNRKAARTYYPPLIAEIEQTQRELVRKDGLP